MPSKVYSTHLNSLEAKVILFIQTFSFVFFLFSILFQHTITSSTLVKMLGKPILYPVISIVVVGSFGIFLCIGWLEELVYCIVGQEM